jgi:hypothetical protein
MSKPLCPACHEPITRGNITAFNGNGLDHDRNDWTIRFLGCACPHCGVLLPVQVDPFLIDNGLVARIAALFGKKVTKV